jgi:hypothetical protein
MNASTAVTTTQEPLDEEERELMDPDTWDWANPIEGLTIGKPGAILRVHFTREELFALVDLAREQGIGPVEFVRRTMVERIAGNGVDTTAAQSDADNPQRASA